MMLAAYFFFAVVDTTSKGLLTFGYFALQLAFFRYASQLVVTSVLLAAKGTADLRAARPVLPSIILRGSFLIVSTIFNFIALKHLALSVTSAIMFSTPVIVCALSWPMLGERVGPIRWLAVAIGFAGVLVVIQPFSAEVNAYATLTLIAATGLALYSIMTRKLAQNIAPLTMQFVLGVTGTVALAPFAYVFWTPIHSTAHLIALISLGCFAWFGHELLIKAHQVAEANFLSPYAYSYLIYMSAAGYVFFDDLPDMFTIIGALMITTSGLLIWHREMKLTRAQKPLKSHP